MPRPAGRGGRGAPHTQARGAPAEHPANGREALAAQAATVHVGPGLHIVEVGELGDPVGMLQGLELPAIHVAALPGEIEDRGVTVVANSAGTGPWLPPEGATIIVQSPPEGGHLLVTVYAPADTAYPMPQVTARRLDRDPPLAPPRAAVVADRGASGAASRAIQIEVALHIHRVGDRQFVGQGWFGVRGQRLHIEAFSIRPLDTLAAADIEFMGFGPGNRQTPWVTDGRLCGTRGRGLPLTGFAVRLAPQAAAHLDVVYEGAFIESGIVGPNRNGEPCLPPIQDDPLEAISLRILERAAVAD